MSLAKSTCPRQSARLSQKRLVRHSTDSLVPDSQSGQHVTTAVSSCRAITRATTTVVSSIIPSFSGPSHPVSYSDVLGQKSQQPLESQLTETETNNNSMLVAQKNNTVDPDPIHHHINNVNDNSVYTSSLYTNTTDNNPRTAHSDYRQQSLGGQRQHNNSGGNGSHQGIGEFYKQKATDGYTDQAYQAESEAITSYDNLEIAELRRQAAEAKRRADIRVRDERRKLIEQLRMYDEDDKNYEQNRPNWSTPSRNSTHASRTPRSPSLRVNEHYYRDDREQLDHVRRVRELAMMFKDVHLTPDNYDSELGYFEHQCERYHVTTDSIKYEVLLQKWPQKDIQDFLESTSSGERNYSALLSFWQEKCGSLPKILRPKPTWDGPVKYQDLRLEAMKWAKSSLEDRIKFFTYYLAPDDLKSEVAVNFGQEMDDFHHKTGAAFVGHEQRALDNARHVDYAPPQPRYKTNRNNRRDNQVWQGNQNRARNTYNSNQHNQGYYRPDRDQRTNFHNDYRPGRDQRANYNKDYLCDIHFVHGDGARKCGMPDSCPMSHLTQNHPKNGFPPFQQ